MRCRLLIINVFFGLIAALSVPVGAWAEVPVVRGQLVRDFVRLTFEWPEPTLFTADTDGNDIILTFDRKADINMGQLMSELRPYVIKAEKKKDGKTIILTLDNPHRLRTFISDNISGIDLLDINEKEYSALRPPASAKKTVLPSASHVKPLITAEKKEIEEFDLTKLEPAAGEEEPLPAAPEVPQEQPQEKPVSQPLPTPEVAPDMAAPEEESLPPPLAQEEVVTADEAVQKSEIEEKAVIKEEAAPSENDPVLAEPVPAAPAAEEAVVEQTVTPEVQVTEEASETVANQEEAANEPAAVTPQKTETVMHEDMEEEAEEEGGAPKIHRRDIGVSMVPISVDRDDVEEETGENAQAEDVPPPAPIEEPAEANIESSETGDEQIFLTSNKIVVSADTEGATLRVPLKERTAMALFIRMNTLWIAFDKKLDFDLSDFEILPRSIISKATILPHDKATILRIPISDNIYPSVKQQQGQFDLAIILSTEKENLKNALPVSVNTEPPAPAHVFLPALEVGETFEVRDPAIGDQLLITPIYTIEQGIELARDFVEFELLPSAQGVAVAKKDDATKMDILRNGLRISLPDGAQLSPNLTEMHGLTKSLPTTASGTLFPDELWRLERGKSERIALNRLFIETVFAPNEGAQNLARLRMAQLYLREGFAVEAIGMLDSINRVNPAYYRSAKLAAMRGVANFLLYRFNDAAKDFSSAELNNNPEVQYWRDMLSDLLGNPETNNDFIGMNENYISKYPDVFRQRLAIVAADRAIASREYNTALQIFDTLEEDGIIEPIRPFVEFLTAKISAENGQEAEAMEVWKRLAEGSENKFVQARASFSAILWELDNNLISRDQAMDKLERLRLRWHGDGLELQVVQLLGDLYEEQKDYVNAMRVWKIGVTGFKNTGPAIEMARKMEDTFIKLFNDDSIADTMTPLEALALYYEYRNYTPTGSTGAQMIERLADRLVGVDLLSTAAQLLEQQMRTQMEKAERSRIGAKLAEIYLMNNQPKRAMKALQDSVYGDNPILQRIYRNQLAAKVMMQLGRPEESLTVLGQDESVGAEKLRAMIYWSEKDWPNMTTSIENLLKRREDPSAPLTTEEGEYVLRLALAYVYQHDETQLQYMRDYFGPLMKDNRYNEAFNFITAPDIKLTTRNFDDLLKSLSTTRRFIGNYKARMDLTEAG